MIFQRLLNAMHGRRFQDRNNEREEIRTRIDGISSTRQMRSRERK
jgi:hypothetical protein